ncbi:hypothetical protein ACOR62_00040 [Neisseria lisongii]|uniref:Phosphoribosyltransferase n=1 Tax=Neisseria lisongii TaxID=2912188 RepID=A0AAW5AQ14_9NEIS|nr:hypothetical protein [Neisseria lisongii]MCF7530589.1 hypothetical protein [Neisseria lisongii]
MSNLKKFTIEKNRFLSQDIQGYYRYEHYGYHDNRTPKYINTLKNDFNNTNQWELRKAAQELHNGLIDEIIEIGENIEYPAVICIVPRSKVMADFDDNQLQFFYTIKKAINHFADESDGTNYIIRYKNTRTTHLNKSGYGGDGALPYPGIAQDTCHFSPEIKGKNILLIDDLYTKTVNIIEDMAQALLNNGAKSVTVFAIGYNMPKSNNHT